jgi:uncharacterized membrane protein
MRAVTSQQSDSAFLSSNRLASLSDTVFGVAMTLLATTLVPSVQTLTGSALDMLRAMSAQFSAVVLSFAIAGAYWMSQQRRLAMTRSITGPQTRLHLLYLFSIVLLPISTSLFGRNDATQAVITIYGAHLVLIGLMNLLLWVEVHRHSVAHAWIVGSSLVLVLFITGLIVGQVRPVVAEYFWFAAFAEPLLRRPLVRWIYGAQAASH